MNPMSSKGAFLAACLALASLALCLAAPVEQGGEQDDFTDEPGNEFDEGSSPARSGLQREPSELAGYNGLADFNALQAEHYPVAPAASSPTFGANHPLGENNMSTDDDTDADEGESSEVESSANPAAPLAAASRSGGRGRAPAEPAGQQEADLRQWSQDDNARGPSEHADPEGDSDAQDSNIANAKVELSARDMATAAGHHHHHGHGVHGWLEMGAKTGKKGAFKWHDKHPVGGKGRR